MPKRLARLSALLGASLLIALPASASAAPQPWWQVVTGSRPSNLWIPQNNVQELQKGSVLTIVKFQGNVVACMGSSFFCEIVANGKPNPETAAQLQEALESPGVYGPGNVEVQEEPAASGHFLITSIGEDAGLPVPDLKAEDPFLNSGASSKVLRPGGSGRLVATLTNLGDAPLDASSTPLTITDELPAGVVANDVEAWTGFEGKPLDCEVKASDEVSCGFEGELPSYESIEVETYVSLQGEPPVAGAAGKVTVSGGNAKGASAIQAIKVSPDPVSFGIEHFSSGAEEEGGEATIQAGAHPFQVTTAIQLNAGPASGTGGATRLEQPALPRNLRFPLPAGLVGNATVMPQCTMNQFLAIKGINQCPDETAIGVSSVTYIEPSLLGFRREPVPVFNLPPNQGEPARFGFIVAGRCQ